MANAFSAGVSAGGSYGFLSGASVSGSMSVDFSSSQSYSSDTKFSQTHIRAQFGSVSLPPPIKRKELRSLASESTLRLIDGCDSAAKAEKIVGPNGLGAVYIRSGTFGAVLTMSTYSNSTSFSSSKELEGAVQAEANFLTGSVSTGAKFSIGRQQGKQNSNIQVNVVTRGGDPTLILRGDLDNWLESSKHQPIMSSFSLAPISDLALSGSSAEKFLLEAVKKVCLGELSKFTVTNPITSIDTLNYDDLLEEGKELKSPNGRYRLVMQDDGNLVGYSGDVNAPASSFWASGTNGKGIGPYHCVMQKDGNVVIYDSRGQPTWDTGTWGKPGHRFVIQDDRNIVLYPFEGPAIWATHTNL